MNMVFSHYSNQISVIIRVLRSESETIADTFSHYITYYTYSYCIRSSYFERLGNFVKRIENISWIFWLWKFSTNSVIFNWRPYTWTQFANSLWDLQFASEKPAKKSKPRHSNTKSFVINKNTHVHHILNHIIQISANNFWLSWSLMVRYRQKYCLCLNCLYVEVITIIYCVEKNLSLLW